MCVKNKTAIYIFLTSILSLFVTGTFAAQQSLPDSSTHGFYVGAQAGYGNQNFRSGSPGTNPFNGFTITSVTTQEDNDGVAGRIMAGYAFNPYLSIEAGAAKYDEADLLFATHFQSGRQSSVRMSADTYSLDLLGKISYPVCQHFTPFIKGGVAYVHSDVDFSTGFGETEDNYRPEVAAGFSIPVNNHVAIETTYSHIFSKGNLHLDNVTPALDTVLIGISINHL